MIIGMTLLGADKAGGELCLDIQVEKDGSAWVEIRQRDHVHVEARIKVKASDLQKLIATLAGVAGGSP